MLKMHSKCLNMFQIYATHAFKMSTHVPNNAKHALEVSINVFQIC